MVRRRRGRSKTLLPAQDCCSCTDSIKAPFWPGGCGRGGPVMPSTPSISRLLPLTPSVFSAALCVAIFCLSSTQLSALIWQRSPANRILFALRQDKHCPCVTPKTFHRLSHFQHGSDIATIGFFLQPKCSQDTMRVKRKKEQLMRRRPNQVQVPVPPGAH